LPEPDKQADREIGLAVHAASRAATIAELAATAPERETIGVMIRDLEVIIENYSMAGHRTRTEGDAALMTEWREKRQRLFDALSDLTARVAALQARLAAQEEDKALLDWCDTLPNGVTINQDAEFQATTMTPKMPGWSHTRDLIRTAMKGRPPKYRNPAAPHVAE
jgi:hypothetical protein